MKILLTGTTTLMSNQQRQKTSTFLSFFPLLYQMLVDLGHEVDWRAIKPGDRLSKQYDLALLGLQAVNGLAGKQYRYGTLWAAHELPHAVVFDDWQVRTSARSLRYKGKNPQPLSLDDEATLLRDNLWKTAMLGRRELEEREYALEHCFHEIEKVRRSWFKELPLVIAPIFGWGISGKFEELHPMRRLCRVDPTAYVPQIPVTVPWVKHRHHYYAGLRDHRLTLRRMGFGEAAWPLEHNMPIAGVRGWGRVTEQAVVQRYADAWSVVSVPYSKIMLGSGWWRSRFNFCAQVGSVLTCDPREIGNLDPEIYGLSIDEIEALPDPHLKILGRAQWQELVEHWAPTKDQLLNSVNASLNSVTSYGPAIQ